VSRKNIIAGLDIGTQKICAIVGRLDQDGQPIVTGIGTAPSRGLKKGIVIDIDKTVASIKEAVDEAEQMSGTEIETVNVGIAGAHISSINSRGVVAVSSEERNNEITESDVGRAISSSRAISIPPEREMIHVLPREFIIDGCSGITDPVGMSGVRLEVETHIVTGAITSIENLIKSVQKLDLNVNELILEPIASSLAVLSYDEKELGVVLVDIGGGTTDIAIFQEGNILYSAVLPVGGDHITGDLAVGLRTPFSQAETLKKEYGYSAVSLVDNTEAVEVVSPSGNRTKDISKRELAEIIQPRAVEILELIKKEIEDSGFEGPVPGGIVLTGGVSQMKGLVDLAEGVLNHSVRIGFPEEIMGLSEKVKSPIFSTGVGLILHALESGNTNTTVASDKNLFEEIVDQAKKWIEDFFRL